MGKLCSTRDFNVILEAPVSQGYREQYILIDIFKDSNLAISRANVNGRIRKESGKARVQRSCNLCPFCGCCSARVSADRGVGTYAEL